MALNGSTVIEQVRSDAVCMCCNDRCSDRTQYHGSPKELPDEAMCDAAQPISPRATLLVRRPLNRQTTCIDTSRRRPGFILPVRIPGRRDVGALATTQVPPCLRHRSKRRLPPQLRSRNPARSLLRTQLEYLTHSDQAVSVASARTRAALHPHFVSQRETSSTNSLLVLGHTDRTTRVR